jgi:hypothetical protein
VNRRLQLQNVLGGLDDEEVDPASGEPADLIDEEVDDLAKAVIAKQRIFRRRQQASRPDRTGHEARPPRNRIVIGHASCQSRRGSVLLIGSLAKSVLFELEQTATKRVSLQHIDAGLEKRGVNLLDDVGVVEYEVLVATLDAAIASGVQVVALDRGSHRAVKDDDALANEFEIRFSGSGSGIHAAISLLALAGRV